MANWIVGRVSFGEEECFQPLSKGVERGGRSDTFREANSDFESIRGKTKSNLLGVFINRRTKQGNVKHNTIRLTPTGLYNSQIVSLWRKGWSTLGSLNEETSITIAQFENCWMGSQWRALLIGVSCQYLFAVQRILAKFIWGHCNLLNMQQRDSWTRRYSNPAYYLSEHHHVY